MGNTDPEIFNRIIEDAIEAEVARRVTDVTEKAVTQVREALRAAIAKITLQVLEKYDVQYQRNELIIRVKTDG